MVAKVAASADLPKKLETFASSLSADEQVMLKVILERGGMTAAQLKHARPFQVSDASVVARTVKLDARFFNRLMDW